MRSAAIILAAGKSTRMKSDAPKVLHEVCGKPMLWYVIQACREAGASPLVLVVGHRKEDVIDAFADDDDIVWVEQREQKGTGHAALVCGDALEGFDGPVLTIAGDMPLIRGETLRNLIEENRRTGHAVTLATSILDDPTSYGRIIRDAAGNLTGIVEHNDCTPEQLKVREVNVSYYCFDGKQMFDLLRRIQPNNAKGEYYITDTVRLALESGAGCGATATVPPQDAMGINSRADLAAISVLMQGRIQAAWMDERVTIVDPRTTWIETDCRIGPETVIAPFSFVGTGAVIGAGCRIGPHACIPAGAVVPDAATIEFPNPDRPLGAGVGT